MALLKTLVKNALELVGLEVHRLRGCDAAGRRSGLARESGLRVMRVAGFELLTDRSSEIPLLYEQYSSYSSQIGRLARAVVSECPDARLLDIGANVGDTVAVVRRYSDMPVICVEGEPRAFGLLEQNIAQFADVVAYNVYLAETCGTVSARVENESWNATLVPDTSCAGQKVDVLSLDRFLEGIPDPESIRIVKIDTEGFDPSIVRGGGGVIHTVLPSSNPLRVRL